MRIFLSPPQQNGLEAAYLEEALATNYLAPVGPFLDRLEARMCELTGYPAALALNSGTAALQLAVRHLLEVRGWPADGRPPVVIAASLTFIASVAPAVQSGCELWLVDSERESWTIDPVLLAQALHTAEAEGRAVLCVIPTDLYGQKADMQAICGLCDPFGIPVLGDAAEALGAELPPGSPKPWAEIISLNGNKIATASAGGILLSRDTALMQHARKLSMQAREPVIHYEHRELGYNARMSHLLAAVALAQLSDLPQRVSRRREIFAGYQARLADVPGVFFQPEAAWNRSSRWLTALTLDAESTGVTPGDLVSCLADAEIECRPLWKPLHQQPALRGVRVFGHAVSDQLFAEGVCLPSGGALTPDQQDEICGRIRRRITGRS